MWMCVSNVYRCIFMVSVWEFSFLSHELSSHLHQLGFGEVTKEEDDSRCLFHFILELCSVKFFADLIPALPPQVGNDTSVGSHVMPSSPAAFTPPMSQGLGQGQAQVQAQVPPQQLLPSNIQYPGDYDFQINLGQPTSQATKSISWTYSPTLKKLFVDRDKSCPIQFKTSTPPPPNCYIRVLPIFKQAENLAEVVTRCPNHVGSAGDKSATHLVVCSDPDTVYCIDDRTGRCSLRVPYTVPPVGTEFSKYLFTFKCFISCVGGLNRRKIQLVFTLENEYENVLGRQVLDVRVCACPGRDRKGEEKQFEKAKTPQKKAAKRGASKVTTTVGLTSFTKKQKVDDEIFNIPVQGREKYELLMKIKESLDLMDLITPAQMNQYKQQQSQLNQQKWHKVDRFYRKGAKKAWGNEKQK